MNKALQHTLKQQHDSRDLLTLAQQLSFEYLDDADSLSVFPNDDELAMLEDFDEALPEHGNDPHATLTKLASIGKHTTVKHSGGRYFGFVNGGTLPVGMAARWLADVWDQNAALAVMSPISAKLETICEHWMVDLLRLPPETKMGLVGGTSVATLCGLAAARYRLLLNAGWNVNQRGLFGAPRLRIIMGDQTHGTVSKMIALLGFGLEAVEWVESDDQGRMRIDKIPALDERCIVILQAGNVCTGAFDDFSTICHLANQANSWVHIDGAFGLWARASEQFSGLTYAVECAHSWSVDGHKTLNTPYDCGIVLCRDEEALVQALHQSGSYIQFSEQRDNMVFTPDMSRRARGIDLWACLHSLGREGLSDLLEQLNGLAIYLADKLAEHSFIVLNEVVFNQVIIKANEADVTQAVLKEIQDSGIIWCGGAKWKGEPVIRLSICSWVSTKKDINLAVDTFATALRRHLCI